MEKIGHTTCMDIMTVSGGFGAGLKGRIGPVHAGLFCCHDWTGMRGGEIDANWGAWNSHYSVDIDATIYGCDALDIPGDTGDRGKFYVAENFDDNSSEIYFVPFILYPSFSNKYNKPHYPYYYFTQLEVAGGLGLTLRLGFNYGEMLDFVVGIFGMDIFSDDLK